MSKTWWVPVVYVPGDGWEVAEVPFHPEESSECPLTDRLPEDYTNAFSKAGWVRIGPGALVEGVVVRPALGLKASRIGDKEEE